MLGQMLRSAQSHALCQESFVGPAHRNAWSKAAAGGGGATSLRSLLQVPAAGLPFGGAPGSVASGWLQELRKLEVLFARCQNGRGWLAS